MNARNCDALGGVVATVMRTLLPILLLLSLGCVPPTAPGGSTSTPTPPPRASITPQPTVAATLTATPSQSPTLTDLEIMVALREEWGLRSDEEWICDVVASADSVISEIGIPATPEEAREIADAVASEPRMRVIAYGVRHPRQYCGVYVEGPRVVLLFNDDLELRRQDVAALDPPMEVEVRPCRFSEIELKLLMRVVVDEVRRRGDMELLSVGLDTRNNVLDLEAKSNVPGIGQELEALYGGRVAATIHPLPGAWQNNPEGEGWRLLSAGTLQGGDLAYSIRVALSDADFTDLWSELATGTELPAVDFEREFVAVFSDGIGSSCRERRLDNVAINEAARVVYSVTSDPLAPRNCTADLAGAAIFVVVLAKKAMPPSPFTVRLHEDQLCGDCPESVEVDLR